MDHLKERQKYKFSLTFLRARSEVPNFSIVFQKLVSDLLTTDVKAMFLEMKDHK